MTNEKAIAERLLQIEAVTLRPDQPFTWASGWKSPIYCDNRRVLSFTHTREFVKSELCNLIFQQFPDAELLAGVSTAGIAWGALAADQLKLPFVYVRPKPKDHGMGNQVEGYFERGQKTVVVEDLISTGKSSLQVVEALRSVQLEVMGMVSIFTYGFKKAVAAFEAAGVPLHALTNYAVMIKLAIERGIITPGQEEILLKWKDDPSIWTGI